ALRFLASPAEYGAKRDPNRTCIFALSVAHMPRAHHSKSRRLFHAGGGYSSRRLFHTGGGYSWRTTRGPASLHHHGFPHRPARGGHRHGARPARVHGGVGDQTDADPERPGIAVGKRFANANPHAHGESDRLTKRHAH